MRGTLTKFSFVGDLLWLVIGVEIFCIYFLLAIFISFGFQSKMKSLNLTDSFLAKTICQNEK